MQYVRHDAEAERTPDDMKTIKQSIFKGVFSGYSIVPICLYHTDTKAPTRGWTPNFLLSDPGQCFSLESSSSPFDPTKLESRVKLSENIQ